jgi:choline kinase
LSSMDAKGDRRTKAVILAAGQSLRMRPVAQNMPKCLLPVNGEAILSRQLRILRSCGVWDIVVVIGWKRRELAARYGQEVSLLRNPRYKDSGSLYSLWLARDLLDTDLIVLNGDVVFTEAPIRDLLSCVEIYCMVVDRGWCDEEAVKVTVSGGCVVDASKSLSPEASYGEFACMAGVRKEGLAAFRESLCACQSESRLGGWSRAMVMLSQEGHGIGVVPMRGPWAEVDTAADYARVRRLFEEA